MYRRLLHPFLTVILLFSVSSLATSGPGDTTFVRAQDTIHWQGYGGYFTTASFPDNGKSYQRVWLKATLGCPDQGCSEWDYTTKFAIYDSTGKETYLPDFKVEGDIRESFDYKENPVYTYIYSGSNIVDSVQKDPVRVTFHNRSPEEPVRSANYWEADRYVLDSNQAGQVVDSHFVAAAETLNNQIDTIYGEPIEIGRAATPYSGNREKGFFYPWYFDVTDYQNLLQGDQKLRAFYRGPRDGFTIRLKFIMIEGTPPREPVKVQNLYKSPATGWYYSFDTSDINNDRFVRRQLTMPEEAEGGKIRVSIKGHGFGDAAGNCSEFCEKWYRVFINENRHAQQTVWRDDCDLTPVYPQTGTWILSRANWCPGTESYPYDHEISDVVNPGEDFTMKMNMEPHNFRKPANRDFTDPRWVVDAQFIAYGPKNFDRDIAITRIIAPNDEANQDRYNPTCGNPIAVIENRGANPITSAAIKYGAKGGQKKTYQWEGNLSFMERDTVFLPSGGAWGTLFQDKNTFEVEVSQPNGQADEYVHNNKAQSTYDAVPKFPNDFRLRLRTNSSPNELSYTLKRKWGKVVRERSEFEANTTYFDTFNLSAGCYEFILKNARTGQLGVGDGLSYFANRENEGSARFVRVGSALPLRNGSLQPNFGRQVRRSFTVGYQLGQEEQAEAQRSFRINPNPVSKQLQADLNLAEAQDLELTIYNAKGQRMIQDQIQGYQNEGFSLEVGSLDKGFYLLEVRTADKQFTKRFIRQ